MFSKWSCEPVQDRSQAHEVEKMEVGFVIACADATKAFDPLKEVFDAMASPVVTGVMRRRTAAACARRNAHAPAQRADVFAKLVAVIALVRHHAFAFGKHLVFRRHDVGSLAGRERELHRAPPRIDTRGELGVEPAPGATDGLILLAALRVGSVLMHLDVRGIQTFERAVRPLGQHVEDLRPEQRVAPTAPARVNRAPRTEVRRQIAPRTTRAQHMNHPFEHEPMIFGWSSAATAPVLQR